MKRSRSGHAGRVGSWRITLKNNAVTNSAADSDPPGCPEPASPIMVTMFLRIRLAMRLSSATSSTRFMRASYHLLMPEAVAARCGYHRRMRQDIGPDIERLLRGEHADPFAVLGPHVVDGELAVRVLRPGAKKVEVLRGRKDAI